MGRESASANARNIENRRLAGAMVDRVWILLLQFGPRTLRYEVDDRAALSAEPVTENYIGALWHNRLLSFHSFCGAFFPTAWRGLISASRDGDYCRCDSNAFGYDVVRGSSSRLGASAVRQLTEGRSRPVAMCDHSGRSAGLRTNLAWNYFFSHRKRRRSVADESGILACWRLGSWDRFHRAATFAKVRVL
jgi:lysophospholipid acyltransferase (LPLAT)-like uncharacterized protein